MAVPHSFMKKLLLLLGIGALGAVLWLNSLILIVADNHNNKYFCYSCSKGDNFQLYLIHSVEKTPWEDNFLIQGQDDLLLTTSKFESLGWGYPYSEEDGKFSIDKENNFLMTMNRKFVKINTCVAIQAMPKIIFGNNVLDLCHEFGDGAMVEIAVRPRYKHYLNTLFGR